MVGGPLVNEKLAGGTPDIPVINMKTILELLSEPDAPKTLLEFYTRYPERWIGGKEVKEKAFTGAIDKDGDQTSAFSYACRCCVGVLCGMIGIDHEAIVNPGSALLSEKDRKLIDDRIDRLYKTLGLEKTMPGSCIPKWNDNPDTTFEEVLRVLKSAGV